MAFKKHFNNFWQTLKRVITRERVWKVIKFALLVGKLIYRIIRLFEGEKTE